MWFGRFSKATDQQVWENYDDRWREPEGLLPDGGDSAAKLHVPLRPCAQSAQPGVKGHCPLREPRGLLPSGGDSAAKPHVSLRPCAP